MNYNKPDQVRSPRLYANHVEPLYDGGEEGYSVAIIENCAKEHSIGIRWNVSEKERGDTRKTDEGMTCVGMPQSRGYSVWFILPDISWKFVPQMIKDEIAASGRPNLIPISEKQIQEKVTRVIEERRK